MLLVYWNIHAPGPWKCVCPDGGLMLAAYRATVIRHERMPDSIRHPTARRRREHAGALARLAYGAYLNFHLDWLSPGFPGPRIQSLSRIRRAQPDSSDKGEATRNLKNLESIREFVPLFESTVEKARASSRSQRGRRARGPRFPIAARAAPGVASSGEGGGTDRLMINPTPWGRPFPSGPRAARHVA